MVIFSTTLWLRWVFDMFYVKLGIALILGVCAGIYTYYKFNSYVESKEFYEEENS